MSGLRTIEKRFYHDYLLPPQFDRYERILSAAKEHGYSFETVSSFDRVIAERNQAHGETVSPAASPAGADGKKYLILRRDVDTPAFSVCRSLLELERKYGARCSYFFRLSTLDRDLAREVEDAGGEASYHYEEIASWALRRHLRTREAALAELPEIRALFLKNLENFRRVTGLPCTAVASHGDFVNRRLKLANTEILQDPELRRRAGILREAYDGEQARYVTCRIADQGNSRFMEESLAAIDRGEAVIYLLTHPRQWKAAPLVNTRDNLIRGISGLRFRL